MASLADVLNVKPPSLSSGGGEPGEPPAPQEDASPVAQDKDSQLATYAEEFKRAKSPTDARDALEAFVRLVME